MMPVILAIEVNIDLSCKSASSQKTLQAVRITRVLLFSLFDTLVSSMKFERSPIKPLLMISAVSSIHFFNTLISSSRHSVIPPSFSSDLVSQFTKQYFVIKSMPPFLSRNAFNAVSFSPLHILSRNKTT